LKKKGGATLTIRIPSDPDAPPLDAPNDESPTTVFRPTPFRWRDPKTFPRRQFVYGTHYIRKYLSVTAAQTKVGKSSLDLVEAVAMASGQDLLGVAPSRPLRVWYWNGEDPLEEIERRVMAICLRYDIDRTEIEGNLFLDSGRDVQIIVATQSKTGTVIATPVEHALIAALKSGSFDVLILDPAISTHRVSENDNGAIDAVAKTFGRIAEAANVAVEMASHTRKLSGATATIDDARGASAWTSAARDVRVLNRMSKEEAAKAGIEEDKARRYFRSDSDGNLAPTAKAEWFTLASVGLGNGSVGTVDDQDYVGVPTTWRLPNVFEGVTVSHLRKVQAYVAESGKKWRQNSQATDWIGIAVAQVLKLDATNKAHRTKINAILKQWIRNGMFAEVVGEDDNRIKRKFVVVGASAND
jgi:uncharacterized protein YjiS (DUF1127 family)